MIVEAEKGCELKDAKLGGIVGRCQNAWQLRKMMVEVMIQLWLRCGENAENANGI